MKKSNKFIIYFILVLLLVLCICPFYIMIINATHSTDELMVGLYLLPGTKLITNYHNLSQMINIWNGFINSIIISVSVTILSTYFGALTAFGLSKYDFPGKKIVYAVIMASMMIPAQLGIIGFFKLCKFMKLLDTFIPLIVPSIANAGTVFFVHQYMEQTLADSLIESARVEGCGEFRIFNKIVFPLSKPAVSTMAIFNFVASWNNFFTPMIILFNKNNFTIPLMIMNLRGAFNRDFGATYCAIAMSIVPIILIYSIISKNITKGLMAGAVKG
jgi:multiple sugar transport system permease protein